ncbi:PrsW family intramembrane metalloprotease [Leptospira idonii]|uniref:Protease PrsW n=1 Tax=Leptospira idonii TaxID=1193500 RepID=A0A4R9M3H5_9LEPT|nr:PrsW family glutamic-type intramembrane protease [Leptospira idonii]TGN20435.1 protease PrsW [Leptospira idonii]
MMTFGLLAVAILPGFVIVQRYYSKDNLQKEPIGIVLKSFFWGAALVLPAGLLETMFPDPEESNVIESAIHYFLVVGLIEELCKYIAIRLYSAKNSAFNEHFDGIVYGACVGGGFATFENIFYVMDHGFVIGILRAFLSVPGHILWGAIIGHWIAKEKMEGTNPIVALLAGVGISTFLHGGFDFILDVHEYSVFIAPIFVLAPLFIVRWYTTSALKKDKILLQESGFPTLITEKNIQRTESSPLFISLLRSVLYVFSTLFFLFSLFLFPFCIYDYFYGEDQNFETWMFAIPSLSTFIAVGLLFWGKNIKKQSS